jgi:2-(3-amino-3-carboxypropyl)histidine synthase
MTQLVFIDARWDGEIKLTDAVINHLKDNNIKSLALFTSVQFTELKEVKSQLENLNIKVLETKAKRTSNVGQILGCDIYHNSFDDNILEQADSIMYIGDGLFHSKALLLAQVKSKNKKTVIQFDPMAKEMILLSEKDIEQQTKRTIANLKRYIAAQTIGILVTIKPGQQYFNAAKKLKQTLEEQNKKAYIFISDTINLPEMENYPFIEAWVNTACPRIGSDDHMNTEKALINLREATNPTKELEELKNE